jgi:DNA-binding response OmpR family regulator
MSIPTDAASSVARDQTILIVEDEDQLVHLLSLWLKRAGYHTIAARNGDEALRLFHEAHPDLVLLDIQLPQRSGWEVCQRMRELSHVPILMLTARGEETDKVKGLQIGADDYVTKPFGFPELLARVNALLRRAALPPTKHAERYHADGPLLIDLDARQVYVNGSPVSLTPTEYRLLAFLAENSGRLLTHREILIRVWGPEFINDVDYVRMYVRALRQKLEPDPAHPRFLLTEHGAGYRLRRPPA